MEHDFLVRPVELILRYQTPTAPARLSFDLAGLPFSEWQERARRKLADVLCVDERSDDCEVTQVRRTVHEDVEVTALVMRIGVDLSVPGYLLRPQGGSLSGDGAAVVALHGHGQVDECLGVPDVREDYHHHFALALAQAGHVVFVPELRGFGALYDLAAQRDGESLNYWRWGSHMTYTAVTDAYQNGRTLMGDTIEDLLRWEHWLAATYDIRHLDVVGISWGGDLACTYPVFSARARSIFASGTLGSFTAIFSRGGNAPAHCIPGVLGWLDRADIAGLNAPRPLAVHYGELDVPGPDNGSASYNETVPDAYQRLRRIYEAAGAVDAVSLHVSRGRGHEMDNELLLRLLQGQTDKRADGGQPVSERIIHGSVADG
jgi:dienelactone hydrolase